MELKDFVKQAINEITTAVDEISHDSSRNIVLDSKTSDRSIEFDIAVTAEDSKTQGGKGGIKVLGIFDAGGQVGSETRNTLVTRIKFGVDVEKYTKTERQEIYKRNSGRVMSNDSSR